MNNVTVNIKNLQKEFPKTWKDFTDFHHTIHNSTNLSSIPFESLPFDWQLGVFIHYFLDSGIDLDILNAGYEFIPGLIQEAFKIQENNISHYS
ncbi:hypothetical protein [uncultured Cytophaga sp.]|uniref:hypothetical protein n=1 Tax=uncultured Cytophaga sp. TaxID=160238 RepID=UPI002629D04E|nr:hypothetical protein [uncultured Cytophaga sp.]